MRVKNITGIFAATLITAFTLEACKNAGGDYPGDEFTHDMIHSRAWETYAIMPGMPDSMSAFLPVDGTVPYPGNPVSGWQADSVEMNTNLPYTYAHTPEDYERAGIEVTSPLNQKDQEVLEQGQYYFNTYCSICHGAEGDGKGFIVTEGKYKAVPPSYYAEGYIDMPDGKMFHSVTYGKGAMQPYNWALNPTERWKVIAYINSLQEDFIAKGGSVQSTPSDTSASAASDTTATAKATK
jgi:mono/diheme cytochrome c family protein